jgi:hypothetical protein
MRTQKAAITSSTVGATSPDVSVRTCVESVAVQKLYTNVSAINPNIQSPLNISAWRNGLVNHPDKSFVNYIIDGIVNGVHIGYTGPRYYREYKNWSSVHTFYDAVHSSIQKDISKGRKLGPWDSPPSANFVGSPMGAFLKKRSTNKYRVIHDLSWPPGQSINSGITDDCSVHYISVDTVTTIIKNLNVKGVEMSRIDLEDAYKFIFTHPSDWELLGSTFDIRQSDGSLKKQYFIDCTLPFGLKSSPKIFCTFAEGLRYIMLKNGVTIAQNYMDDYFTCGLPGTGECERNLQLMISTCIDLGFSVQSKKTVPPTCSMEFLGIEINSNTMELRISDDRLREKSCVVYKTRAVVYHRQINVH